MFFSDAFNLECSDNVKLSVLFFLLPKTMQNMEKFIVIVIMKILFVRKTIDYKRYTNEDLTKKNAQIDCKITGLVSSTCRSGCVTCWETNFSLSA